MISWKNGSLLIFNLFLFGSIAQSSFGGFIIRSYSDMPADTITLYPFWNDDDFSTNGISKELWSNPSNSWITLPHVSIDDGVTNFFSSNYNSPIAPYGRTLVLTGNRFTFTTPIYAVGFTNIVTDFPNINYVPGSFDNNVPNVSFNVIALDINGNVIESVQTSSYGNILGPVEFGVASPGIPFMSSFTGIWSETPIAQISILGERYDGALVSSIGSLSFSSTPPNVVPEPSSLSQIIFGILTLSLIWRNWRQHFPKS